MINDPDPLLALPEPDLVGRVTLEGVLGRRRSTRDFEDRPIAMVELGQLLWAAQGVSDPDGLRTAPSAGALYPLEVYAIARGSGGLRAGIYHYVAERHGLEQIADGDFRADFAAAALGQEWTAESAVIFVIAAAHHRTMARYGERGRRYAAIEAGHAAQNICLQAASLGLYATQVGAFRDNAVARLVRLPADQEPVTSVVVGQKQAQDDQ